MPITNGYMTAPTCFGFDMWGKEGRIEEFPGIEFRYTWNGGGETTGLDGSHRCGTDEEWLRGCLFSDGPPSIDPATGQPVCCGPPRLMVTGGEAHGGEVLITMGRHVPAGGEAHGGALVMAHMLHPRGGEAHGGLTFALRSALARGGEAHGGGLGMSHMLHPSGGEALGGVAFAGPGQFPRGGEAHGGNAYEPSITIVQETGINFTVPPITSNFFTGTAFPVNPDIHRSIVVVVWVVDFLTPNPSAWIVSDTYGNPYSLERASVQGNMAVAIFHSVGALMLTGSGFACTLRLPAGHNAYIGMDAFDVKGITHVGPMSYGLVANGFGGPDLPLGPATFNLPGALGFSAVIGRPEGRNFDWNHVMIRRGQFAFIDGSTVIASCAVAREFYQSALKEFTYLIHEEHPGSDFENARLLTVFQPPRN